MSERFSDSRSELENSQYEWPPGGGLARSLKLRKGELLYAQVETILPGPHRRLLLNIKGQQVVAASQPNVSPGDSLVVKVVSLKHPIELKIYRPRDAGTELTDRQLDRIVGSMGLTPTSKLTQLTRLLLETDIFPDLSVLTSLADNWALLIDPQGKLTAARLQAAIFLLNRDLPLRSSLLNHLSFLSFDRHLIDWDYLARVLYGNSSGGGFALFKLLRQVGFDLPGRLLTAGQQACDTLHAKLLRKTTEADSGKNRQALALILAIALHNCSDSNQLNILLPVPPGKRWKYLQLFFVKPAAIGHKPCCNWQAHIQLGATDYPLVGLQVEHKKQYLGIKLRMASDKLLNRIDRQIFSSVKQLKSRGYRTRIVRQSTEPEPLADPLAVFPREPRKGGPGVDYMA